MKEKVGCCGTSLTSDCFLLGTVMFFRKNTDEYRQSSTALILTQSSSYFAYNMSTGKNKNIISDIFYRALKKFRSKGGLSKVEEEYLYGMVIDNNFAMHCLLTSEYM